MERVNKNFTLSYEFTKTGQQVLKWIDKEKETE